MVVAWLPFLLFLALTGAPAESPTRAALTPPARLSGDPRVQAALREADARQERYVQEWIRIAEIPAPSGGEDRRADHVATRLRGMGLEAVHRDRTGNVVGLLRGRDPSLARLALVAHLDTVAAAAADHRVTRLDAGRLSAPGVRDNASGLAGLLAAVDLMRRHGLEPPADTFVVASVKEEVGLEGARRFVEEHAAELGAFVAVDGYLGQISYGATGIAWYRFFFRAPGGHTLEAHERPSAVLGAARAIERIGAIPLRRSPPEAESWLNIGVIGGGTVPNAQARDAWFTVDLRSNDPQGFEALEIQVMEAATRAAREVGVQVERETLQRMPATPAAQREPPLLAIAAQAILEHLGWREIHLTPRGTADHNVALARGIPGIAIGVTTGRSAHSPDEVADVGPFTTGVKQLLLLALTVLTSRSS